MKVLMALLGQAPGVVSRNDVFEQVWGRQIVSEDALSRSVSDIRAELRRLCGRDDLIETLPKRGYRWVLDVGSATTPQAAPDELQVPEAAAAPTAAEPPTRRKTQANTKRIALGLAVRAVAYLAAMLVMASLIVWGIDRIAGQPRPIVAVLPLSVADPALEAATAQLNLALTTRLLQPGAIDLLARTAVESRPSNPFPYFFFEFGARWLIESELRLVDSQHVYTASVVDARTGVVLFQANQTVDLSGIDSNDVTGAIGAFIESQADRRR